MSDDEERPKMPESTSTDVDKLVASNKRELAIELILGGMPWGDIAARLQVDPRTVNRWKHDPRVIVQVRAAQKERRNAAAALVAREVRPSIETLVAIRDDKEAPVAVRRACARDLLEIAGVVGKDATPLDTNEEPIAAPNREAIASWVEAAMARPEPAKEDA